MWFRNRDASSGVQVEDLERQLQELLPTTLLLLSTTYYFLNPCYSVQIEDLEKRLQELLAEQRRCKVVVVSSRVK